MIIINEETVVVFNDSELSTAVGCGNTYKLIYFGADIQLSSGITICPTKETLIIDGTYEGITYTFTDMNSINYNETLGIRAASSIQITIRNMIINGRNYYGVPYITDLYDTSNLSLIYENVKYSGRQITYNPRGFTRYIDCDIEIINISASWTGEEVGEVNRVEIGGITTISKNNQNDAVFYFLGNSSTHFFKILENADVTVSTTHYFMYASGRTVPYTIERGASLKLSTNTGISYSSGHSVAPFIVEENASFEYVQTSSSVSVYIPGTLTVKQGARFFMRADYTGSSPLLYFTTSGSHRNLNLENPKSFVLYKRNTSNAAFAASRPFLISGEQVNYWQTAAPFPEAGTFDDFPLYQWHNPEWSNFEITGNAGSSMSNVSSNLIPPIDPPLSNLQLQTARVLSVGNIPLTVSTILSDGEPITGTTDPYANVLIEYNDGDTIHTLTGTADTDGSYSISTLSPVPPDTEVSVSVNVPFLFKTIKVISEEAGELYILSAPSQIRFTTPVLSQSPTILRREANVPVVIMDTRFTRTDWQLSAFIDGPMHTSSGYSLNDAVVYVPHRSYFSDRVPLSTLISVGVFFGTPDMPNPTNVLWEDDMGILMNVTAPLHLGEEYTANIIWDISPV